MTPSFIYAACVEKVIDADTIDVAIDLGFRVQYRCRIRVAHVDAAERHTTLGREAWAYVRTMIEGETVTLTTSKPDKYGRTLALVEVDGVGDLAADLIAKGFGVPYEGGTR